FAKASKQILGSGRAAGNKEAEELDLLEDEVGEENGEETSQEVDPHSIEPTRTPLSMTAPRAVVIDELAIWHRALTEEELLTL
ncbi:MAG: hypothetical protein QF473_40135, partial [Planctomycetota bacterium]|nr:hypothetical protein [Planctomycetota bacterium]